MFTLRPLCFVVCSAQTFINVIFYDPFISLYLFHCRLEISGLDSDIVDITDATKTKARWDFLAVFSQRRALQFFFFTYSAKSFMKSNG